MSDKVVFETNFPGLSLVSRGKVRDIYDFGDRLLIVATDRISAFDVVMPNPIPDKGIVLTELSAFWLNYLDDIIDNHFVSVDFLPMSCRPYSDQLRGRSMWVKKAEILPIECWEDYQKTGCVCGIELPKRLVEAEKLPEPIFTPSTKAKLGEHDENIPFVRMAETIGQDLTSEIRETAINLYVKAAEYANNCGIILADTKFEFGIYKNEQLMLVDEVLTPDSSRFWPADRYKPGGSPESFDKQFLRDYLKASGWKKTGPAPQLPEQVITNTRSRYVEALKRLTGKNLDA